MIKKKIWSEEENNHLVHVHKLYSISELAEMFECTEKQIYNKLHKLKLLEVETEEDIDIPEGHKRCSQCKEIRLLEEFHNNRSKPDGKSTECKYCARENNIIRWRKKKAEQEMIEEAQKRQEYIDSLSNKKLVCKHHGEQTIDDYRICKNKRNGNYSRKCKKCESEYQKQAVARRLKEQGYV